MIERITNADLVKLTIEASLLVLFFSLIAAACAFGLWIAYALISYTVIHREASLYQQAAVFSVATLFMVWAVVACTVRIVRVIRNLVSLYKNRWHNKAHLYRGLY